MATALYVAQRALRLILVEAEDSPLTDSEYTDFYNAMNDYMADLEARGVSLGYTPVSAGTDTITIPPGALRGLISAMAIEAAPDYSAQVSPALAEQARIGLRTLRRLGRKRVQTAYPPTLPRGSGNMQNTYNDAVYDHERVDALITLTNNTVATVIGTVNTPVRVAGFWSTSRAVGLVADINGRIRNALGNEVDVDVLVQLEVTGGSACTVHLYENGNLSLASVSGTANGTSLLTLRKETTLLPSEFLELWIENDDDDTDLTVRDCQFEVS